MASTSSFRPEAKPEPPESSGQPSSVPIVNESPSGSGPPGHESAGTPFPVPPPFPSPVSGPASCSGPGFGPHPGGMPYPPTSCGRMMFYPPPMGMGYPPGQVPYGYPPPPMGVAGRGPAYAQVPPSMYYPYPPPPCQNATSDSGSACFRALVLFLLIVILGFFVFQYILSNDSFSRGPDDMSYGISSLSVSNLSTTDSMLSFVWESKIEIKNPYIDSRTYFRNFMVTLFFKNDPIMTSYGSSFQLNSLDRTETEVKAEYNSGVEPQVANSTVDEMAKERETGWINFSLKLSTEAHYDSDFFYVPSRQNVEAECNNLRVHFQNGTTSGTFNSETNPVECFVLR